MTCHPFRFKKSISVLAVFSLLFNSACAPAPTGNQSLSPTDPLYQKFDITTTSIHNGNMNYTNFLSTDGSMIYFQSDDGTALVKSKYDGSGLVKLSGRFPSFINIVDTTVFFIEGTTTGKIYKVKTDGTGESLVVDTNAKSLIATPAYLYFIDTKDGFVYRTLHDGSGKIVIFSQISSQLRLVENTLYVQVSAASTGLYTLSVKETGDAVPTITPVQKNLTKFNQEFHSLNISGSEFYFIDSLNHSYITLSKNGNPKVFLNAAQTSPFILSDQYIYYINTEDESRLYRVPVSNSSKQEMIINDRVSQFVVCGNSIYYRRESNLEIYRTPIVGGQSVKIT